MRIAVILHTFPKVSETFILRQITGLLGLGHEVDIYAETGPDTSEPVQEEVAEYGLLARTTYIAMPVGARYEIPSWPPWGKTWIPGSEAPIFNWARLLKAFPRVIRCLARAPHTTLEVLNPARYGYQARSLSALYRLDGLLSRRARYDVVHAHFGPVGNSFRFARRVWKAPLVVSFHGYDFGAWPRKEGRGVYTRLFMAADIVTANSNYTRTRLVELGCDPGKLRKLPMGVDPAEFELRERSLAQDEAVRLLTVGRLVEKKGIEFAIRAVAQICEKHPEVRYSIVGEGPLRPKLARMVAELSLEERVVLHGALDGGGVRKAMEDAHLFVLPSVTANDGDQEGQGLVLQEAQACGLPVLATDHSGFSESIVQGESGLLVPERDIPALAEALTYLIENPELWPQMGRKGREHVEKHYDIRALNHDLVRIYGEAIERYKDGKV
jgi:colanic acid/amylovoran biosynthesis glycosyltransferase